jgi:hypothetical protein
MAHGTNMVMQYVVIGIVLCICIVWIYRRLRYRSDKNDGQCCGCEIKNNCLKSASDREKSCKKEPKDLHNTKD